MLVKALLFMLGLSAASAALNAATEPLAAPQTSTAAALPSSAAPAPIYPGKFWYLSFDQGFGGQVIPIALRSDLDSMGTGTTDYVGSLNLGLLGLYFRLGHSRYLIGSQMELFDNIYNSINGRAYYVSQSYLALSAQCYFGPEIGNGFFARTDFGSIGSSLNDNKGNTLHTVSGTRWQFGGGYAIPLGKRHAFSLVALLNNIVQTDESGGQSSVGTEVRVGVMF